MWPQDLENLFRDYPNLLRTGGGLSAALLGYMGAREQRDMLRELSQQQMAFGAPSRARYEGSFAPGFTMGTEPGYSDALDLTTKSFLHKASMPFGNPADSPNAWTQTLKDVNSTFAYPALQEYRRQNMAGGGLAALTAAAPGTASAAIGADKGRYDALGYGLGTIFNPQPTLADLLRQYRQP